MNKCAPIVLALLFAGYSFAKKIDVTVVTDTGAPIPEAVVNFHPTGTSSGNLQEGGAPDKNGRVSINLTNTSEWKICAGAPAKKYLDSCMWESDLPSGAPEVIAASKIAPGTADVAKTIALRPGLTIQFRIEDPKSLLWEPPADEKLETKTAPEVRHVQLGVITAKGHFFPAIQVESTPKFSTYEVLVPNGIPLVISASATNLQVLDARRLPPSMFGPERFTSSAAEAAKVRSFSVDYPPGTISPPR